jgi:hypothetical protein
MTGLQSISILSSELEDFDENSAESATGSMRRLNMSKRSYELARRLELGALSLEAFASSLTEFEWQSRVPGDGRKIGVVVHHVASVYPVEIGLAQTVAKGEAVEALTMDVINKMNAAHAKNFDGVTKVETVELLKQNSAAAATAIRLLTDQELDQAAPVSLYANAILTCQFILEDHAVRHSYHHLGRIRAALQERTLAKLTA